jgi:hypothetical protein
LLPMSMTACTGDGCCMVFSFYISRPLPLSLQVGRVCYRFSDFDS